MEINLCEQAFYEPTEYDVTPVIYYRMTKPLKRGAVLPTIANDKIFYGTEQDFQFAFTTSTTLSHYNNKDIVKALVYCVDSKNQALREVYLSCILAAFPKDLWRKAEDFLVNYPD